MELDGAELTWLGHATFLVKSAGGKTLVIDPWLSGNPKCPPEYYGLDGVDVILITHGHSDHMGSAIELARRTGATVISNHEIVTYLGTEGIGNGIGMNKGGTVAVDGITVTMVSADHSSSIATAAGTLYGGEPAGFVVTMESGLTLYHAGDTNVFGDMATIRDLYAPDIALLPIGGHYTMGPKEAAYAVKLLGVSTVVPMHYGTFPLLAGSPEALAALLAEEPVTVAALEPGQSYS